MRVLWISSWWKFTSSYSVVTRAVLPRLADLVGRDNVALAAIGALAKEPYHDEWLRVIPLGENMPWARSTDAAEIARRAAPFHPDVVVMLYDARFCPALAEAFPAARVLYWMPIDTDPVCQYDLAAIGGAAPVAMSRFGLTQLQRAGLAAEYVPLGVDPRLFRVLPIPAELAQLRAWMVGPGCEHLTVTVAANFHRKHYQGMLQSWAEFAANKPSARLYCHTQPTATNAGEEGMPDLYALAEALGIGDRVFFPPSEISLGAGYPAEFMPMLYNCAHVLLATSAGEGFGLPIVEAQACGVPVVTTDWTAMPELVRWGTAVKPLDLQWVPTLRAWWAWPDAWGVAKALEDLYTEWAAAGGLWPLERRCEVSAQVREEYGWDNVWRDSWVPLLNRMVGGE